jgi:hypothetical protein
LITNAIYIKRVADAWHRYTCQPHEKTEKLKKEKMMNPVELPSQQVHKRCNTELSCHCSEQCPEKSKELLLDDLTIRGGARIFVRRGQKNIESGLNSLSDLNPLTNWVLDKKTML